MQGQGLLTAGHPALCPTRCSGWSVYARPRPAEPSPTQKLVPTLSYFSEGQRPGPGGDNRAPMCRAIGTQGSQGSLGHVRSQLESGSIHRTFLTRLFGAWG